MLPLSQVFVIALLVESLAQTVMWITEREFLRERLIALFFSLALCMLGRIDMFTLLGFPISTELWGTLVGSFFTGVLTARGSTYLHDLFTTVQGRAEVARAQGADARFQMSERKKK